MCTAVRRMALEALAVRDWCMFHSWLRIRDVMAVGTNLVAEGLGDHAGSVDRVAHVAVHRRYRFVQ